MPALVYLPRYSSLSSTKPPLREKRGNPILSVWSHNFEFPKPYLARNMSTHERRTELKSNLLADRLEGIALAIKPHIKLIGVLAAALAILGCVYAVMSWQREKAAASAWSDFYFSGSRAEVLRDVYEGHPTQSAGLWARQANGDALLGQALSQVYLDRDLADKLLTEASDHYRHIINNSKDSLLVSRATYGLAQVFESQGKAEEALKEYRNLATMEDVHPEMRADILRRTEFLQSEEGQKFNRWYSSNRPAAPKAVDLPKDLNSLPDKPDINFTTPATSGDSKAAPPTSPETKPSGNTLKIPEAQPTQPAVESKPAVETTPASETKPAAESKPDTESKPADQKPAEGTNDNPLRIETPPTESNKGSGS